MRFGFLHVPDKGAEGADGSAMTMYVLPVRYEKHSIKVE